MNDSINSEKDGIDKHEVRNHLNNVSVNAELIKILCQKDLKKEDSTEEIEAHKKIIACAEKILLECKSCSLSM